LKLFIPVSSASVVRFRRVGDSTPAPVVLHGLIRSAIATFRASQWILAELSIPGMDEVFRDETHDERERLERAA
jgi:hypothetical protein